jgi:para-aminobenzoate synthetase/4-amino-4-deoxychorismate lyase
MTTPFVLLDDARPGGKAWLYRDPAEIVEAREPEQVRECLARLRGRHAAGFLAYEAGHALEARLTPLAVQPAEDAPPLLWFGLFGSPEPVDAAALLGDGAGAWAGTPRPLIEEAVYRIAAGRVLEHIRAGDVYQANLTFPADVPTAGSPPALYAALRTRARAGHSALIFTGRHWVLSLSPELFFTLTQGCVTTPPMKGTAPPDADPAALRDDPKQRAENLMIVDLIRNDLSRVSRPGTVKVPELFAVERYPTVLQMTSTVTAELAAHRDAVDVLEAIFPCGSITGAPKIRAMEILRELEPTRRGPYTGALGWIGPDGSMATSILIRTFVADGTRLTLHVGGGITYQSDPAAEWDETVAKARGPLSAIGGHEVG